MGVDDRIGLGGEGLVGMERDGVDWMKGVGIVCDAIEWDEVNEKR